MKEYKTIKAHTSEELDKLVTEAITQGCRLHGSPYAFKPGSPAEYPVLFFQVVVGPEVQAT
jgi:hypothetical protein